MSTALAVCDRDGRLVFANPAFAALARTDASDVMGTPLTQLVDGRDAQRCDQAFRSTASGKPPVDAEIRLGPEDMSVWCRVRFTLVPRWHATHDGVVGIFENIAEHKTSILQLGRSNKRYRLAVDRANDIIFNIDLRGRFTFVNPTACLLTKYSEKELLGMHYLQLIPEDWCETAEAFYANQVRRQLPSTYFEFPVVARDGEVLWLGQYVQLILEGHNIASVQAMARDITQRRRAEDALRQSEERLRTVVSSVPIVLWATDEIGRLTLCEGRALSELGLSGRSAIGRLASDLIDDPDLEDHLVRARRGESFRATLSVGERMLDSWFAPVRDDQGTTSGVIGVAMDVTEQRRLQNRLHQIEKLEALGQLAGGVAHDFNNQLTAILGYCELLAQTFSDDDPRSDDLREIAKAGRRSAAMTEQLLAYGRRQPRQPRVIDLNEVIANIEPLLRRSVREDVQFQKRLSDSLDPIGADPAQIEHVILNLVLNARDAVARGGSVTLSTAMIDVGDTDTPESVRMPPGRYVSIEVTDTGEGMDEGTRERVFEPFFTTKDRGKGTGLGLASVYGIVKQSGGYIWVTSRVGRGTTFQICLPPSAGRVTRDDPPKRRRVPGGSETILVVEDDPTVRKLADNILRMEGYHVLVAEHGGEALDISRRHDGTIDLLLTDIVLPGIDGKRLAERIRELRPGTSVVFTTGYPQDHQVGLSHTRDALVGKPFVPSSLLLKIRQVLDRATTSARMSSST